MLERAGGCTGGSPGASKELAPKVVVPCSPIPWVWRHLRNSKEVSLAQSQGNARLEVPHRARRGFPFPVGLMGTAEELNASNSNSSDLSKGRGAPPREAVMGRGELWTAQRAMPSASFLVRHSVPKLQSMPPGASWATFDTLHTHQFWIFTPR